MAIGPRIIDRDMGLNRIQVDIKELSGYSIHVGLMGDESYEGTSIVDIGLYNEFGTSRGIPARPFMSKTHDEEQEKLVQMAVHLAGQMMDGKAKPKQVLDTLGLYYQSRVQNNIRNAREWAVPNAPGTIKQKGSSSPLIDTGRMLGAVKYEVVKE